MKHKTDNLRYRLLLTPEQAYIVSRACELYSRLRLGQLHELNDDLLLIQSKDNICERRNTANELLFKLKELYFPQLQGLGHSYGVGHDEYADRSWNVHHALRYKMAWTEHPEGGIGVNFDPPWPFMNEPAPPCDTVSLPENESGR